MKAEDFRSPSEWVLAKDSSELLNIGVKSIYSTSAADRISGYKKRFRRNKEGLLEVDIANYHTATVSPSILVNKITEAYYLVSMFHESDFSMCKYLVSEYSLSWTVNALNMYIRDMKFKKADRALILYDVLTKEIDKHGGMEIVKEKQEQMFDEEEL